MNQYVNRTINYAFCTKPLSETEKEFIREGYTKKNASELIQVATKKKVLPVVGKMLLSLDIDSALWSEHYNYFKKRNIEITNLADRIFDDFSKAGISRICAFENYGALLSADTDIALYSSGDIDLYADVTFKNEIIDVLKQYGYKPAGDASDERNIMTEFKKENSIIRINVAWKPLRRMMIPFKADTSKYFEWEDMPYYKNTSIRLPSKETLLYLCFLRIAVHGFSRSPDIRLYIDTFNASRNNPNWDEVMEWASNDNVLTKFATVAIIAHKLIKLDIPDEVLQLEQKDSYIQSILNACYDTEQNSLRYDPTGIKLLKVEAASDNKSLLEEVVSIVIPPSKWIKEYYCLPEEKVTKGYIRYYKRLL